MGGLSFLDTGLLERPAYFHVGPVPRTSSFEWQPSRSKSPQALAQFVTSHVEEADIREASQARLGTESMFSSICSTDLCFVFFPPLA